MENLDHELPYVLTDALWFPEGGNGEHSMVFPVVMCSVTVGYVLHVQCLWAPDQVAGEQSLHLGS